MIEKAQSQLAMLNRNFTFLVFDAEKIPFTDGSFDCVIANHMLYHVKNLPKTFEEIHRVLKPKGKLYASANGNKHLITMIQLIRSIIPDFIGFPDGFTLENGAQALNKYFHHFEIRKMENGLKVTHPAPLLQYIRSMSGFKDAKPEQLNQLEKLINDQFLHKKELFIEKESGIFIASK